MKILLLAAMMIFTSSAFAGLYKWVDDEGNVHYSQKRPIDQQYKRLKAPNPAPENTSPLYQQSSSPKDNDAASVETAKNEKARADKCDKAKKNLSKYQVYRRMRDKDGNVRVIDDIERAKQIKISQEAISDFCN